MQIFRCRRRAHGWHKLLQVALEHVEGLEHPTPDAPVRSYVPCGAIPMPCIRPVWYCARCIITTRLAT